MAISKRRNTMHYLRTLKPSNLLLLLREYPFQSVVRVEISQDQITKHYTRVPLKQQQPFENSQITFEIQSTAPRPRSSNIPKRSRRLDHPLNGRTGKKPFRRNFK